jgi:hypothetical protein
MRVYRSLAVAVLPALALALLPSTAAAAHARVVVTKIVVKQLPGPPPYIVLDESSTAMTGFVVEVTVQNTGTVKSHRTVTDLLLEQRGRTKWAKTASVRPLQPGHKHKSKFTIDNVKLDPGFVLPVATADVRHGGHMRRGHQMPVVPRDWNVSAFQTNVSLPSGVSGATQTTNGFYYRLTRFDGSEFLYSGYGQIQTVANFSQGSCTGHGSDTKTHSPWPGGSDSELAVKANLSQYSAGIVTDTETPLTFTVTCSPTTSFPLQEPWVNLVTWENDHSWITMQPYQISLDGDGKATIAVGKATYHWVLHARISGV